MDLESVKIKKEKETAENGHFTVGPLPAGYGVTLGTALRRVLLSSLPGGAIVEVRIQGVSHPFTSLKGVREDMVEILLNLKKVRFKLRGEGPYEGTLEVKGKKVVTAENIKISSEAQVANPDLKIASLTDKSAKLSISLRVERGVGYKLAEEREGGKVGVIPIDSLFSPVTKVAFRVEPTRVGRKMDLDRLALEVVTDGTIKPSEAIKEAAKILQEHFENLGGGETRTKKKKTEKAAVSGEDEVRKTPTSDLDLPPRIVSVFEEAGIKTVGGLIQRSEEDLLGVKGFGKTGLTKVRGALKKLDVSLKE